MGRFASHANGPLPQGSLYQLWSKTEWPSGTPVAINGPHDKYGYVVSTVRKEDDGRFLLLLRGTYSTVKGGASCNLPQF